MLKNKSRVSTGPIIIRMSVLFPLFFPQCEVYISFSAKITAFFFLIDVSFNFSLLHFLTGHHQFLDWKQNKTKQACLYLHAWMKNEQVNPSSTCWSKPAVLNWWQLQGVPLRESVLSPRPTESERLENACWLEKYWVWDSNSGWENNVKPGSFLKSRIWVLC